MPRFWVFRSGLTLAIRGSDIRCRGSFEHPLELVALHLLAHGAKPLYITYQTWYTLFMETILAVKFFANSLGTEPVRDWLKSLVAIDRKTIGEDIKTVQLGWPLGMPLVGHLGGGLWEVRIKLDNRIARVLFVLDGSTMVLLHGFIKKQQVTPKPDLDLAKERMKELKRG